MKRPLILILSLLTSTAGIAQSSCDSEGYREFDFWLGSWVVYTQDTVVSGYSDVSLVLDSCVLMEEWSAASSEYQGKSFNSYNVEDGIWTQTWVDNSGVTIHFFGSYNNGVMHFTGRKNTENGVIDYILDFTVLPKNEVRQVWKATDDGGESWITLFDGVYKRRNSD